MYEATWTVESVLDLLEGTVDTLHLEPQGEDSRGVEFYRALQSGAHEYHSVKRQAPSRGSAWTPYELNHADPRTGRSILGDLFGHLDRSDMARAVFVSQDSAGVMRELTERARAMVGTEAFIGVLSAHLSGEFDKHIVPIARDATNAHDKLRRCEFATVSHHDLIRFVEQRVPALIQHADGRPVQPGAVRLLLQEFAWSRLGQVVTSNDVVDELERHAYARQPLAASGQIQGRIADRNGAYLGRIRRTLVNGAHIPREQARHIADDLLTGSHSLLLAGTAGEGKSCIGRAGCRLLSESSIPHVVLSMDELEGVISTAELGERLGLPASPAIVLGLMSAGGSAVLCIDQLDALSSVSGRNVQQRQVLEELIQQASRYPELRLLLACRSFDLEHDDALLGLVSGESPTARQVDVELLSVEDVRDALATARLGGVELSDSQVGLLRTPLHLYLFLGAGRGGEGFDSPRDLFDRYWDEKRRGVDGLAGEGAFAGAVERLSGLLSDRRQLQVSRTRLASHESALEAMASEGVVVINGSRVSFFHASFFDYAFARGFVNRGQSLVDWLEADGQDLFRRSQVRQVLEFLREDDASVYSETLSRLLRDGSIRFHLKRLTLDWLGQLPNPREAEWTLLEQQAEPLRPHILGSIRNREAWFDLLDRTGVMRSWLASECGDDRDRALYLLRAPRVFELCSAEAASLLRTLIGGSDADRQRLLAAMSLGDAYHSREMMDLFLDLIDDGTLDGARGFGMNGDWWGLLYQMARTRPDYCSEAIGHWLDRQYVLAGAPGHGGFDEPGRWSNFSEDIIKSAAEGAPLAFALELTPRVSQAARGPDGETWNHSYGITRGQIVEGLSTALRSLAVDDPDSLDDLFQGLNADLPLIIDKLRLDVWASNPNRYADHIVGRLLEREELLGKSDVGRAVNAGTAATSRELTAKLEEMVLRFAPKGETGRWFGYSQHRLLSRFAPAALSDKGVRRREELRRKFGDDPPFSQPIVPHATWSSVPPRIPDRAVASWSDENWLHAMRTVEGRRSDGLLDLDWDRSTLSSQLRERAKLEPQRFARLAADLMSDDLPSRYFSAILDAVAGAERDTLTLDSLIEVIRTLNELPGRPCGLEITRAVRAIAAEAVPPDVVTAVAFYATEDPDPDGDEWMLHEAGDSHSDDRALTAAINSVRGAAAEATAALLFADATRFDILGGAVDVLVRDPTLSVRSVAVLPLLAILRDDESRSLRLFNILCQDAAPILGTPHIEQYLHHAIYRSYESVRPILLRMLESQEAAARRTAARQVCLAALHDGPSRETAMEDAARVESGDAAMRTSAAEVYAKNCGHPDVAGQCAAKLPRFFDDGDEDVRRAAAQCFRRLDAVHLSEPHGLIAAFATSAAFVHSPSALLFRLKGITDPLPASVCSVAERATEVWGPEATDISTSLAGDAARLSELIVRYYAQESDEERIARALDVIDRMIGLGFMGIDDRLGAVDRA